uniref:Uncharacterized protein n=1 Tax=Knipowitschia caucasica TaxID=637954 RepID=A0AAV2JGD6_KNICA
MVTLHNGCEEAELAQKERRACLCPDTPPPLHKVMCVKSTVHPSARASSGAAAADEAGYCASGSYTYK